MPDTISMIISCRNEEAYIRPFLASVLAFQLPPGVHTEVLLLDERSTDHARDIID